MKQFVPPPSQVDFSYIPTRMIFQKNWSGAISNGELKLSSFIERGTYPNWPILSYLVLAPSKQEPDDDNPISSQQDLGTAIKCTVIAGLQTLL